jgi:RAB protein geranylgeranyltransferase component A
MDDVPIEPTDFDVICLGTGLVEAIVAGCVPLS